MGPRRLGMFIMGCDWEMDEEKGDRNRKFLEVSKVYGVV